MSTFRLAVIKTGDYWDYAECEIARMRKKFISESSMKQVILHYSTLIHYNVKGGWVGTLPVSLHHRSMECKSPFKRAFG